MSNFETHRLEYSACLEALSRALREDDAGAFFAGLDRLTQLRGADSVAELRELTGRLQGALDRFSIEARLADIAEKDIPDARARLVHVIRMTDEAAHRTLDLVEQSGPLAERTAREAGVLTNALENCAAHAARSHGLESLMSGMEAFIPLMRSVRTFLSAARENSEKIKRNLADVLLAQGYQDLTGQIIRSVIRLVEELEDALGGLTRLSAEGGQRPAGAAPAPGSAAGFGPAVPGVAKGDVASGQTDVDALLSGLGM
jgi:chemotaxis protein CheZ